ncbi:MAG: hypothetical protein JXR77_12270 [Lentisphaeria bacterium]|nr:hypothetical protein [Lentisphaeria bacterium]
MVRNGVRLAVFGLALVAVLSGCGTVRDTLPARSALEQSLISTAADRALGELPGEVFGGRRVFLDTVNLDCLDKSYVIGKCRQALLDAGAILVKTADEAEMSLEIASGTLSLNRWEYLFGIPALPMPIPYNGEPLKLPEVPFWKRMVYRGEAKMLLSVIDPKTGARLAELPTRYGSSQFRLSWYFIIGPFRATDMPEEALGK